MKAPIVIPPQIGSGPSPLNPLPIFSGTGVPYLTAGLMGESRFRMIRVSFDFDIDMT
jgi:hypothetical protein